MVYWLLGLLVYLNQRYLFEKSLNNLDCVQFIGVFGLFSMFIFPCVLSINQINRFISPCVLSLDSRIVSGLLVYLVYRFICPLFIFPCVLSINQINRFISPCVLSLDSGIVSGLLVYLVYRFISPCVLSNNQINRLPFFLFNGFPEVCTK